MPVDRTIYMYLGRGCILSLFPIKLNDDVRTVAMISYWLPFECHYIWTISRRQTGECAPTIKMEIVLSVLCLDPGVCRSAYDLSIVLVKIVGFCTHRRNLLASTKHKFRQILNLARPGRGTGESTIKMSISLYVLPVDRTI